jgi:hypothetical protein
MHEYLAPAMLLVAILAGIWLNRRDYSDLKADINLKLHELRAEMNLRLHELKAEMNLKFDKLDRRMDKVDDRLDGIDGELKRFVKLEGRVEELSRR